MSSRYADLLDAIAFSGEKHRNQRRKDAEASPYINHPLQVAHVLASEGCVSDLKTLIAAVLHDTVEDTETTFEELVERFGKRVAGVVKELTDEKMVPKVQRKREQAQGLYVPGGHAYIYTVYNRHALFNIATHDAEHPDTVLIRAVEPTIGVEEMLRRRGLSAPVRALTAGPGVLTQALGITPALTGRPVTGEVLWFEDHGEEVAPANIVASARVGLEYAGPEAAGLPWRFRLRDSKWTSPAR